MCTGAGIDPGYVTLWGYHDGRIVLPIDTSSSGALFVLNVYPDYSGQWFVEIVRVVLRG